VLAVAWLKLETTLLFYLWCLLKHCKNLKYVFAHGDHFKADAKMFRVSWRTCVRFAQQHTNCNTRRNQSEWSTFCISPSENINKIRDMFIPRRPNKYRICAILDSSQYKEHVWPAKQQIRFAVDTGGRVGTLFGASCSKKFCHCCKGYNSLPSNRKSKKEWDGQDMQQAYCNKKLPAWCRIFLEKLIVTQLVKKFSVLHSSKFNHRVREGSQKVNAKSFSKN
jgi:hypothetical protein